MYLQDQICCPNLGENSICLFGFEVSRSQWLFSVPSICSCASSFHFTLQLNNIPLSRCTPLSPSTSAHTCMGVRPSTGTWETSQWEHPQKEGSLSHSYPLLISSHLGWCLESTAPIYAGLLSVLLVYMAVWVHVCNSHGQSSWVILHCVAFFDPFICWWSYRLILLLWQLVNPSCCE